MQQLWQPEPLLCRFAWPCSLICSSSPSALPFCPPLPAPPADGRYCTVDPAYQSLLLELVLLTAVEQGWPLSWLPLAGLSCPLIQSGSLAARCATLARRLLARPAMQRLPAVGLCLV